MTQTSNELPESPRLSLTARILWIVLILSTLYLCYFHNLGALGLVGPDEPRYAWIARDMQETGDYITPRLYGKPWFEKPPLYYWDAALCFRFLGVSETSARFPSAISALLATLALAWLALRLYGGETARWLLLLLPTTVGMIGFSHAAATDMPFAAMLTMAMVFAAGIVGLVEPKGLAIQAPKSSFYANTRPAGLSSLILFGFFLGLAALAKGPAVIILSGGAVLLWAVFTKRWRDAFRCLHPVAIASFCLTALPWYILCARRNPDFFRVFIIEHNFNRFLTPEFQHIQPFWFYFPVLLIAALPWTLSLVWSAFYGITRGLRTRQVSPATILLLSWSGFCLLFFTISKSKLPGYILPAVPAIGLLLARSVTSLVPQQEKTFRWLLVAFSALSAIAFPIFLWVAPPLRKHGSSGPALIPAACVLLLFGVANLLLANVEVRQTLFRRIAPLCVAPVLLLLWGVRPLAAPWLRYDPSGKTLAAEILNNRIPPDQLFAYSMHRGQQFSLNFYLRREIPAWDPNHPQEGYLLRNTRSCHVARPWSCSANPIELGASGWFAYEIRTPY